MPTKAGIFNMAIGLCGVLGRVTDPENDTSTEAEACRVFYDQIRGVVIEACPWPFLTERQSLTSLGTPPDGWLYRYKYPNVCKRINKIVNPYARIPSLPYAKPIPYAIQNLTDAYGRAILTDQENAIIEFNRDITDPTLFSSTFTQALAIGLGAHISAPIRADAKIIKNITDQWQGWLSEAAAQAMREQQDDQMAESEAVIGRE